MKRLKKTRSKKKNKYIKYNPKINDCVVSNILMHN